MNFFTTLDNWDQVSLFNVCWRLLTSRRPCWLTSTKEKELDHIDLNKIQWPAVATKTRFLLAHSRGLTILVSVDVVKCFFKQRRFPTLGSKLVVFREKFVQKKKKKLYCFVNQCGQLISGLKTKDRLFTGGPNVVRCQMRKICLTVASHLLVKSIKKICKCKSRS